MPDSLEVIIRHGIIRGQIPDNAFNRLAIRRKQDMTVTAGLIREITQIFGEKRVARTLKRRLVKRDYAVAVICENRRIRLIAALENPRFTLEKPKEVGVAGFVNRDYEPVINILSLCIIAYL